MSSELKRVPLYNFHLQQSAKMGAFAGYSMPLSYAHGATQEHIHTRAHVSLFDVSHMGQIHVIGDDVGAFLEYLLPISVSSMPIASCKYTVMLNEQGGIIDDVILTKKDASRYHIVMNAACREKDTDHIKKIAQDFAVSILLEDNVLLAIQGPQSEEVLSLLTKEVSQLTFMQGMPLSYEGKELWINRSGYTGEDGFELSIASDHALSLVKKLYEHTELQCAGLGARDSLRLEAGLPLYGTDMTEDINPIEANLKFAIAKKRREQGGFVGSSAIMPFFIHDDSRVPLQVKQLRVGVRIEERTLIRSGAEIFSDEHSEHPIGWVSSGAITPSVDYPICFAYVPVAYSTVGTTLWTQRRDKRYRCSVTSSPFVLHNYKR